MGSVTLHNTADFTQAVKAADGDEVLLPPKSSHSVDDKFLWNLPRSVRKVGGTVEVKEAPVNVTATKMAGVKVISE